MNKIHKLKTVQPYFDRVWECTKTFEIRKNDRDFQAGDSIHLMEFNPETNQLSGRVLVSDVIYVLHYPEGLRDGYVALSIAPREWIDNTQKPNNLEL